MLISQGFSGEQPNAGRTIELGCSMQARRLHDRRQPGSPGSGVDDTTPLTKSSQVPSRGGGGGVSSGQHCHCKLMSRPVERCALCERLHCACELDKLEAQQPRIKDARSSPVAGATGSSSSSLAMSRRQEAGDASWSRCAASVVRWPAANAKRRTKGSSWSALMKPLLLVPLLLALMIAPASGAFEHALEKVAKNEAVTFTNEVQQRTRVCRSMDIRNSVDELKKLRGCRVIEGFLQILLIQRADGDSYKDMEFPELVEITGYLLLYRVDGLRSIGRLFPNLTVIRGNNIFFNHALVVFEVMHLQEIGLHSLTDIVRGSVRIDKNPMLCYADTIDWDMIAKTGKGDNFIGTNKPAKECPICEKDCPVRATKPDERLCWNKFHCQKVCKCGENVACTQSGECCHSSCLGGCNGPSQFNCTACKDVVVNENQCMPKCPADMYVYSNRRCVTAQQCRNSQKPKEQSSDSFNSYKPFEGICDIRCPSDYEEKQVNGEWTCKKCEGRCYKECPGRLVDNMSAAQKLRGCTHINGSLEIVIRDAKNVVKELEISLSHIEVITGYLRVLRSFPLVSLNFFKSLVEIRGEGDDMKGIYTLVVLNNPNLQELWNFTGRRPLKIGYKNKNGEPGEAKIQFHYNAKLCISTIEELRVQAGLKPFTEVEVSPTSNGDRAICNVTTIKTDVFSKLSSTVMVQWEPFKHHDLRKLLGYMVYVKEAPSQNVSLFEERDACGSDGWRVVDVLDDSKTSLSTLNTSDVMTQKIPISDLKPFTQYAYYVKTYMISNEQAGAQSEIKYFTTLPGQPSQVRAFTAYSNASDTLVLNWLPPIEPNSQLTHYKVKGTLETYDYDLFKQRDYCAEPILSEFKSIAVQVAEEKSRAEKELEASKVPEPTSCTCQKREMQSENEVYKYIAFEDALINQIYVKNSDGSRRHRRDIGASVMAETVRIKRELNPYQEKDAVSHDKKSVENNGKKREHGVSFISLAKVIFMNETQFEFHVPANETSLVIRELRHYGKYNIEVQACRDKEANIKDKDCSTAAMKSPQTLRKEHADDIPPNSFVVKTFPGNSSATTTVKLSWKEPPEPNGIIVSYLVEYNRVDVSGHNPNKFCVTADTFMNNGSSYQLPLLPAGNYSVRVYAQSFAGDGAKTDYRYFVIADSDANMPFWKIMLIVILCVMFIVGVLIGSVFYYNYKYGQQGVASMRLIATVNPEYVSTAAYVADEWEVPREKIQLLKELGAGSFGMVYEGIARNVNNKSEVRCAVKTVNDNASDRQRIEFLNEAAVMKGFQAHHVVRLLGVVSNGTPTLVIMELMLRGDLKTYLRKHRPDSSENEGEPPPSYARIVQMSIEVADGMAYLAARKFVHRDLAARNIMVAEDLTVKIGDFGMTRDIYETDYYRKGTKGLLPVRWMPPESLKDGVFSSSSDVWSYGVVLWEMVTLASQPYQGLSNDQVLRYILNAGVMERPENCPDNLYILMRQTWMYKPAERPSFIDIIEILLPEITSEQFEQVSFYHSPEGIEAKNQNDSLKGDNRHVVDQAQRDATAKQLEAQSEVDEAGENSPLRQDFNQDFPSSFDPLTNGSAASVAAALYNMDPYTDEPKTKAASVTTLGFLDLNSSKTPLKAGFDDFDGVSSAAASLASSKDTLNLPFVEDNVGSVKSSPYNCKKSASRGNVSQGSASRTSLSPQSPSILGGSSSPGNRPSPSLVASSRSDLDYENRSPDYENRSPELVLQDSVRFRGGSRTSLRGAGSSGFPSMDAIDAIELTARRRGASPLTTSTTTSTPPPTSLLTSSNAEATLLPSEGSGKPQSQEQPGSGQQSATTTPTATLNNGYIGGSPAT